MYITELGHPVEVFNVVLEVRYYGVIVIPCSSLERAENVIEKCYNKYADVLSVSIQQSWLDEFTEYEDYLH